MIKLGIAPIGWTNDDLPELGAQNTFEQCISEMALAGFSGCEIGNKYPRDPKLLGHALTLRKMEIASAWFSTFLTTAPYEETEKDFLAQRDFLNELGAKVIVVSEQGRSIQKRNEPVLTGQPIFSTREWKRLTEGLERLGQLAQEKKMAIVYHHHMGTGVQTAADIHRLMAETNPETVSLLLDTGHLVFSGDDPIQVLHDHAHRIRHVHLKDVRFDVLEQQVRPNQLSFLDAVKKGVFTVPGDGEINFAPLFEELAKISYSGWLVVEAEQDPAIANPFEYALKARKYIQECANL